MAKYIPDIQDQLRRKELPRYFPGRIPQYRVNPIAQKLDVEEVERWEFQNTTRTEGIILATDFVALQASHYTSFERFCALFQLGLEAIHSAAGISLVERIGLRYVNSVCPETSETWADYFQRPLLGPEPSELGVDDGLFTMQFQGRSRSGTLILKVSQQEGGIILPPDLMPNTLHLANPIPGNRRCALLDIDHFTDLIDKPKTFTTDMIFDLLWRLHDSTDGVFRYSVTDTALKRWGHSHG